MRAEIHFNLKEPVSIPIQYNHIIQAIIFSWISDEKFKDFIHNKGYKFEERAYKLFTFSKINGRFRIDKNNRKIIFYEDITLLSIKSEYSVSNFPINLCH